MLICIAIVLNQPEYKPGEVLIPWSFMIGSLGFVTAWLVATVMEYTGLSRGISSHQVPARLCGRGACRNRIGALGITPATR
jgi:hypothetical protein